MADPATFVLVHGAWHGGWCYARAATLLRSRGHTVFTPTLTGQGERAHLFSGAINLSTHIEDVLGVFRFERLSDVVLVGHSYGGMVVTGVADRIPERIKHLVFLDAFQPADGQSLFDLTGQSPSASEEWQVAPMRRNLDPSDPEVLWGQARRHAQPQATFSERLRLSKPVEDQPFSLTYLVATG